MHSPTTRNNHTQTPPVGARHDALAIQGLTFTYPNTETPVLSNVTMTIGPGQHGFLLGPSGSGKSTLLRCISGLETDHTGSIRLGDAPLEKLPTHRRRIGMLFQEPALFPHLDVVHNVAFGLAYHQISKAEAQNDALAWLDVVGLADRAQAAVDELSGGERQRVALARTLAARPKAVLLDEPLAALDRALRERVGPEIRTILSKQEIPTLWVTHDEGEARRLGDIIWDLAGERVTERNDHTKNSNAKTKPNEGEDQQ